MHAEQKLLDNFARHAGPKLSEQSEARRPIEPAEGDWLLFAEVPHLHSYDLDYPSMSLDEPIGYARGRRLKTAAILHDIMPLTYQLGPDKRRAFADLVAGSSDDLSRLQFTVYAHALARADLVIPVSRTSGELLVGWLKGRGHGENTLPPIVPMLLPEEVLGIERVIPHADMRDENATKEFLTVGTVCAHKNQLITMAAFQRLIEQRPELNIRLNVVGTVSPDSATPAALLAKRAKGRIVLHGHQPDQRLEELTRQSYATVFVSLAEGYGLPVAESLWHGKPCICSNEGSIAEIAEGGGCVPVDPRNADEIEAAIESLAADRARYNDILERIAARRMRSWTEYAGAIVDLFSAYSAGGAAAVRPVKDETQDSDVSPAGPPSRRRQGAVLTFSSSDFDVPKAWVTGRQRSPRHAGAIRFERALDGEIEQEVLFFGPYVWLPAGRYSFAFDGEVEGALAISFAVDESMTKIAKVSLRSFDRPVVFDLPRSVNKFEIIGSRTRSLERLSLRHVLVDYRPFPLSPGEEEPEEQDEPEPILAKASIDVDGEREEEGGPVPEEEVVAPTSTAAVRSDEGRDLSLPLVWPAAAMRVHDAYGRGARNRLRAGDSIVFDAKALGAIDEQALFFGPYFHFEPGEYAFRFRGALKGSMLLRFTSNFASETFLEVEVKTFDEPVRLRIDKPSDKVEIIGRRLKSTRGMTLSAIEIAAVEAPERGNGQRRQGGILARLFGA